MIATFAVVAGFAVVRVVVVMKEQFVHVEKEWHGTLIQKFMSQGHMPHF